MSTDSQGRPLSDDGQWAWSGTEWVPAAGDSQPAAPQDMGATIIAPSPFAGGVPSAPAGAPLPGASQPPYGGTPQPPQGGTPGFGGTPGAGYGPIPGSEAAPGYGSTPGYGEAPAGAGYGGAAAYGTSPQQKSRKPLIFGLIGVLVVAAVVIVLIFVLGGDKKKGLAGSFTCSVAGVSDTGKISFTGSDSYTLSGGGKAGKYTLAGNTVTFASGSLAKATANYDSGAGTLKIVFEGQTLSCKK